MPRNRLIALARNRTEELGNVNRENLRLKAALNEYIKLLADIISYMEGSDARYASHVRTRFGEIAKIHNRVTDEQDPQDKMKG